MAHCCWSEQPAAQSSAAVALPASALAVPAEVQLQRSSAEAAAVASVPAESKGLLSPEYIPSFFSLDC